MIEQADDRGNIGAIRSQHELDKAIVPEQNAGECTKPGEDHPAQQWGTIGTFETDLRSDHMPSRSRSSSTLLDTASF